MGQLYTYVKFFLMRWRDKTESITACVLERFCHGANASNDVGNDGCSKILELLRAVGLGIKSEPNNRINLASKIFIFENELGNEESSLAINGRDANLS